MKSYIGNCINPPMRIETLVYITENAQEITMQEFDNACYVPEELSKIMNDDYTDFFVCDAYYFLRHSAIEYIFN